MSRSTFQTTNELTSTSDLRFHPNYVASNRTNDNLSNTVQSSTVPKTTNNSSITRKNPKVKRNLRDKRRATGIRPNEVSLASTSTDGSASEDDQDDKPSTPNVNESNEFSENNRTVSAKPPIAMNRVQSSFENLTIPRTATTQSSVYPNTTTKLFRPEQFIIRRIDKPISENDSSTIQNKQYEERILTLESMIHEKDAIINDLQRKFDNVKRELNDAEKQIAILHQEKITLIKAFTSIQDMKSSSNIDSQLRSNFTSKK